MEADGEIRGRYFLRLAAKASAVLLLEEFAQKHATFGEWDSQSARSRRWRHIVRHQGEKQAVWIQAERSHFKTLLRALPRR